MNWITVLLRSLADGCTQWKCDTTVSLSSEPLARLAAAARRRWRRALRAVCEVRKGTRQNVCVWRRRHGVVADRPLQAAPLDHALRAGVGIRTSRGCGRADNPSSWSPSSGSGHPQIWTLTCPPSSRLRPRGWRGGGSSLGWLQCGHDVLGEVVAVPRPPRRHWRRVDRPSRDEGTAGTKGQQARQG
jgi:hypothetical protein